MPTFRSNVRVTGFTIEEIRAAGVRVSGTGTNAIIDLAGTYVHRPTRVGVYEGARGLSAYVLHQGYLAGGREYTTHSIRMDWRGSERDFIVDRFSVVLSGPTQSPVELGIGVVKSIEIDLGDGPITCTRSSPLDLRPFDAFFDALKHHLAGGGALAGIIAKLKGTEAEVVPKLRFGFELETQRSEGATSRPGSDRQYHIDEDRMRKKVNEIYKSYQKTPAMWWEHMPVLPDRVVYGDQMYNLQDYARWVEYVRDAKITTIPELIEIMGLPTSYRRQLEAALKDRANKMVEAADFAVPKDLAWFRGKYNKQLTPLKLEVGTDGSVNGFEFRTQGGLTVEEFDAAAKHLLTEYKQEVDTGCSFHLHVSTDGARSMYSEKFQAALIEYLLRNMERVPKRVRERWQSPAVQQYALAQIQHSKYTFVHCHELGTWEFRCFGNIVDLADATVCRQLATEAMIFAGRAVSNEETLVFGSISNRDWNVEMQALCKLSRALDPAVRLTAAQIAEANRPRVEDRDEDEDDGYYEEREPEYDEPEGYEDEDGNWVEAQ